MDELHRRRTEAVGALLNPTSVAIVGASERPGAWPERIRANLLRFGFAGKIYAVNPNRETIWGERCYPTPGDLPAPADHLIVLVPAEAALEAVRQGAKAGSRSATIFSAGFDVDGLADLSRLAAETGMAVSGPNCLGNISAGVRMVTTTDSRLEMIKNGSIAIVGQSGGVVTALHRALVTRGAGVKYMVSSGNETVLSTSDYVRYFAGDSDVRVVAAFVESLRDTEGFFAASEELAARGKRLVALKVGQSPASQAAAASHTGALAGSYKAFAAVAARHGVVTVPTLDVAVEVCELLSRVPAPTAGSVGVVSLSGGVRELALDSAYLHGVEFAALSSDTERRIAEIVGPDMEVSNPLDSGYAGISDATNLLACVNAMAADPAVGMVLLQEELLGRPSKYKEDALKLFNESFPGGATQRERVPVALFSMTTTNVTDFGRDIHDALPNLAFVQSVDRAMAATAALFASAPTIGAGPEPDSARTAEARALLRRLPIDLGEAEAKQIAGLYGVGAPEEAVVATPEAAAEWAAENGPGPFVVKVVAAGLQHKSESGGVRLDLEDDQAVRQAATEIAATHVGVDGFLVAKQVVGGIEMIVGFQNDREVGPVVAVGLGGTSVELYGDVKLLPAGCTRDEVVTAIRGTVAGRVLDGFRGDSAGDLDAVVDAVCAVSALAADLCDELVSFEINPLVALEPGRGVVALDALAIRKGVEETYH